MSNYKFILTQYVIKNVEQIIIKKFLFGQQETTKYRYFRPTWDSRHSLSCEEKKIKNTTILKLF